MKRIISAICAVIMCAGLFTVCPVETRAAESQFPSETNAFVSDHYLDPIDQEKPFFDVILPEIRKNIKENNTHSVTPSYDKMPLANNKTNFQSLGSTTYPNINGKKVTAEAFYRVANQALCDPNYGMGILIYQAIEYKRAHPEEDVKITFSSYRTSVTASVCVIPESKYYGYMRSLYGTNYDEHGFVRISFMLVEAARMGIEVTTINQLNSYAVSQYNPATGKNKSRMNLDYDKYFQQALKSDCYNKYAPGKKVSDFMKYAKVGWTVEDKTNDMQHVKSASVSHYLATDGTEHGGSVFFGSANLDESNYLGANGNNKSQSGVIISDHDELFRVTYNYMQLMYEYRGKEEMFELRKLVNERNDEQIALINSGKGHLIPKDEQIVYLGTENDPVFELYFTPFGGAPDTWNTEANPFAKYLDKLPESEDYVEFIWNEFGYGDCHIGDTLSEILADTFCNNPNINNKIAIRVTGFNTDKIQKLALGSEIGYRSIKDGSGIHSKDILMSYVEDGVRHRVSLMTSCNFYMIAFNHRTNSLLVINETEESGGNFYELYGQTYSYNMINSTLMVDVANLALEPGQSFDITASYNGSKTLHWTSNNKNVATVNNGTITAVAPGSATVTVTDGTNKATVKVNVVECLGCYSSGEGLICNTEEQYSVSKKFDSMPLTFEAVFTVDKKTLSGTTTILGSDGRYEKSIVYSLNDQGQPRVMIRDVQGINNEAVYVFKDVNAATGEKVHLAIVSDFKNKTMSCYVNGALAQTITGIASVSSFEEKFAPIIGGDYLGGNSTHFTGTIDSVAIWSDIRSAAEIANDYSKGIDVTDPALLAAYDLTLCEKCMVCDRSDNGNDLIYTDLWLTEDELDPIPNYEYSFAVIGDTQTMNENDPEAMGRLYDWILENEEAKKIKYVIGLGDITDNSSDSEWDFGVSAISKLNGKIPYILTRGNHDDWNDFNRYLHNGFYETSLDGLMNPGKISLTDINQPGLIKNTLADGSVIYTTRYGNSPEGGNVQGDLTNAYQYLNVQGTDYLILTLDFGSSQKTLDWANTVISAHPDHKVIIATHAYMYRDGTTITKEDLKAPSFYTEYEGAVDGDEMWDKCFSLHENIVMVLSGHDPWQSIVYRQDKGVNGNTVTQMLIDPQYIDLYAGSHAMVAMLYFSNDGETLTVRYYSTEKDVYGSAQSQFTVELGEHKHVYDENGNKCLGCGQKRVTITKQPDDVTKYKNETANVKVSADGDGLTYKWYYKNAGSDTFYLTTTFTSNYYSAVMNADRNGRQVYCVITDKYGNSVTTNVVTLTTKTVAKVNGITANASAVNGGTASVTVNAEGDGLTYKWYYKNKEMSAFATTSAFTGNTYSVEMNSTRNGRQVYCVITDKYGNKVTTETVTLTMHTALKITKQPVSVSAANGATATVTISAAGEGLTYKWYYKSKGMTAFAVTTSFVGNTYSVEMNASRDGRQVYCVITDKYGNKVTTNTVTLTMAGTPLKITKQPVSVSAANGAMATVTVSAAGEGLTYKWYYKSKGMTAFAVTTSFVGNTYSVEMNASRNGREIYCVVTDKYGNTVKTETVSLNMK